MYQHKYGVVRVGGSNTSNFARTRASVVWGGRVVGGSSNLKHINNLVKFSRLRCEYTLLPDALLRAGSA